MRNKYGRNYNLSQGLTDVESLDWEINNDFDVQRCIRLALEALVSLAAVNHPWPTKRDKEKGLVAELLLDDLITLEQSGDCSWWVWMAMQEKIEKALLGSYNFKEEKWLEMWSELCQSKFKKLR